MSTAKEDAKLGKHRDGAGDCCRNRHRQRISVFDMRQLRFAAASAPLNSTSAADSIIFDEAFRPTAGHCHRYPPGIDAVGPLRQFAAMHFGGKAVSRVWFA